MLRGIVYQSWRLSKLLNEAHLKFCQFMSLSTFPSLAHSTTSSVQVLNKVVKFNWRTAAIVLSIVQCLIMVGLESTLYANILSFFHLGFGNLENTGSQAITLVYFTLFILGQIVYLLLVLNSVYGRNTLQVLATTIFNLLLFGYTIVQHTQILRLKRGLELCLGFAQPVNDVEFAQLGLCTSFTATYQEAFDILDSTISIRASTIALMIVFNILGSFVAYKLFAELGWSIYKEQGADIKRRTILQRYHIFILLLKLNVYFFVCRSKLTSRSAWLFNLSLDVSLSNDR